MTDLSQLNLSDLAPEQLEFLRRRLQKAKRKPGGKPRRHVIERRAGTGPRPLSFAQQRLWFIHQLEGRSEAYHIPIILDLRGAVDFAALEAALGSVVRRHEVLRTTFEADGGQAVQVVRRHAGIFLPRIDLRALGRSLEQDVAARLTRAEGERPFDLEQGPVLRALVVLTSPDRCRLLLTLHHVAADNWSVGILMKEVLAVYNALAADAPPRLPEPAIQYADFTVWQRERLRGDVLEEQLAFWRERLAGAPALLELPGDRPRPERPTFRFGRGVFRVPRALRDRLKKLATRRGTTLYNVLLAAFQAFLHLYTGRRDVIVGSPVAGRHHAEIEGLIGFFVNTLVLRNQVEENVSFEEFLARVHESSLSAFSHQDLPFERIVEDLRPERDSSLQPLFQVMFNLYDGGLPELRFAGLEVEGVEARIGTWNDLDLLLVEAPDGLEGYLRYSEDLFEPATAGLMADSFAGLLEQIVRRPTRAVEELELLPALVEQAAAARRREQKQTIAVAASFTAELLQGALDFWISKLDLPAEVSFAPYNQIFQQVLDPASLLNRNHHGVNVVLFRFEDWVRYQGDDEPGTKVDFGDPAARAEVERNAEDLIAALEGAARGASVPLLMMIAPMSPAAESVRAFRELGTELTERLGAAVEHLPDVYLVSPGELSDLYGVADLHDPYTDRIGHVPYTPVGFTAVGTLIARRIHALSSAPVKVLVLDCDNTLWQGVCGEDGPRGVKLDPYRRELQEFAVVQQAAGVLLGLCSKNHETDVWETFDRRPDFPLRREHLTTSRINWLPKSRNLREMAAELNLGLDSFVFVDDNPVECAEVRANCPQVMVLELPGDEASIPTVLRHFWAFDRLRTTAEDRHRTALYRQMLERTRHREASSGFAEFLDGLGLEIDVSPMCAEQLPRAAQLTQRTNQFNASTIRRGEGEIRRLQDRGELSCLVVHVRDRFGDYGLVGVAFVAEKEEALEVDTFLLSCRVLGRGVEHRLMAVLGEEALARGRGQIRVPAAKTARNQPAYDFLREVAGESEERSGGDVFHLTTAAAAAVTFSPEEAPPPAADAAGPRPEDTVSVDTVSVDTVSVDTAGERSARLASIAAELVDAAAVHRHVEARRVSRAGGPADDEEPATPTEARLATIFAQTLGLDRVGRRRSFFDLGGHSLLGTVLLSRIRDAFGVELPVIRLFEAPSVARLAEVVESRDGSHREPGLEPIVRISADGPEPPAAYPTSYPQEGLWLVQELAPSSTAYNIPMILHLAGRLRHDTLRRSFDEIVRRHWVLRTRFEESEAGVSQVVLPAASRPLPLFDLAGLPAGSRDEAMRRHLRREVLRPFDLAAAPPLRTGLLRLGEQNHVVYLVVHHTIFDGWSMGVLVRELVALYKAFARDEPSPLAELPIQYVDFAGWQRRQLSSGALEPQLAYWRERLRGAPTSLALPADRPRPPSWSYRGAGVAVELPAGLSTALAELGHRSGCSLYMSLLAAFQTVLCRISGQTEVLVGSPVAQRNRTETEGLLGFLANTLVFRSRVDLGAGFRDLLEEARRGALAAYAHQDLPFEKLVEELRPERDLSRSPLFQVMFILQNAPLPPIELPELTLSVLEFERTAARFDLLLELMETPSGLRGTLEYSSELFDVSTVVRCGRFLRSFLAGALAEPGRPLAEISLLSPGERHEVLVEWNDTAAPDSASEVCLHQLFEAQAARTPEAEAVRCAGEALSYRELERRSRCLGRHLQGLGVGPEVLVGVLLERSVEMVVALLGVLEAGGAYLPLDPSYPEERLRFFVEDAAPRAILTTSRLRSVLSVAPPSCPTISLDTEWSKIEQAGDGALSSGIGAGPDSIFPLRSPRGDSLAYVIYTSGSTGRPKGAMNAHRGIVNRIRWMQKAYGLDAGDRVLQKTPFSFDVSVWEFFWPLLTGARLVMARPEGHRDPDYLVDVITEEGITTLHFVPSMLRAFLESGRVGGPGAGGPGGARRDGVVCGSLRRVIASGEELPADMAERFFQCLGHAELHNLYGPTEAAVDVTAWPCRPSANERGLPIGRPIDNLKIHLLDTAGRPVPVGVAGELHIGGVGVGRGYYARPALTAQCFVPDPYATCPGGRLYRTGDLSRRRGDGAVEFLGRIDHQVKIRGFRIELGEIEHALRARREVRAATVIAHGGGEPRLVAYVVPREGEVPSARLREALRESLPEYMVPAVWVTLEEMPLLANGKVNRKALPEPVSQRGEAHVMPRTPWEELVAGFWAEMLGVGELGVEDNLFDLGAHSLMATRVKSRLDRELGIDLPLRRIFELPTVALEAAEIERLLRSSAASKVLPPIRPVPRDGELPLSFSQQRVWFFDRWEPGSPVFNMPAKVTFDGELSIPVLQASLGEVIRRHEALRTRFLDVGGMPAQVTDPFASRAFPVVDLSALPAALRPGELRRLEAEEATRPFDLERGPLLRAHLVRLAPQRHAALLNLHHIVADGWSLRILTEEVSAIYGALAAGEPPPLHDLPIQYADYAVWQRQWLRGEVLESELAFWKARVEGAPDGLDLPFDRPRHPVQRYRAGRAVTRLPAELTSALRQLSREVHGTLFMALLTAWKILLARYAHQTDITVGTVIANRHRQEVEGLIGFFINTLVLRSRLSRGESFRQTVAKVREATLETYSHQDLPFEKLVEDLNPERHMSLTPLFQVMFILQNMPEATFELPGLRLTAREIERQAVNYDLLFTLDEHGEAIEGHLDYDLDLFDATTVHRLLAHFGTLIEALLAEPDRRWSDLSILNPAERHQMAVEWNDSWAGEDPEAPDFYGLFAARAARSPVATAVACGARRLSYEELRQRTERAAAVLADAGAPAGEATAILAERGLDFLIATLALYRLGAAYLPLDPGHPDRRIAQILEGSRVPLLLVSEDLAGRLGAILEAMPEEHRPRTRVIETLLTAEPGAAPPPRRARPKDLAYVLFTSGSTGVPKGVMIDQRGMVNHLWANLDYLGMGAHDVLAQNASQCFDISVWQFFAPLVVGATVRIVPDEVAHDPAALLDEVEEGGITVLELVPSLLTAMLDEVDGRGEAAPALRCLRTIIPTGEALPPPLCQRWLERYPDVPMVNAYGPAECADDVTLETIRRPEEAAAGSVAIGRPVRNLRVRLLDARGRPVAIGVVGEIHIGGAGPGRGYRRDPRRTAEAFVPDPLAPETGARLYRSGDLGRFLPDGRLEFHGRLDHQVKVRGFRIETGEIETLLRRHHGVAEAVVIARCDDGDVLSARLVAYVAGTRRPAEEEERKWTGQLRDFLAEHLPDYMVPATFVVLRRLPLLTNGKVDMNALPAPEEVRRETTPPRTPTEKAVAEIWREVLGRSGEPGFEVDVKDSFFALGGHSLLTTQVLSRLRASLGVNLPLRDLFEAPDLESLADRIGKAAGGDATTATLVPAPPEERELLSFAQERLWFLDQFDPGSAAYNLPNAVRVRGAVDGAAFVRSIDEIVRRHHTLRMTFHAEGGPPRLRVRPPFSIALPRVDLSALGAAAAAEETRRLARHDARRPFDLEEGPLLRTTLLVRGPEESVLLVVMHHIVSDGWSTGVFLAEFAKVYPAFAAGRLSPLPELPIQYPDYGHWQRRLLTGEIYERQLAHWRRALADAPPAIDLPGRAAGLATADSGRGAARFFHLPAAAADELRALSQSRGTTLFMTLLAGFATLLARLSGVSDLMIGVPVAGRGRPELEALIGFFVNTLVLRADFAGRPSVAELLEQVRRTSLDAFTHQDLPFEKLVAELNPDRDLDRSTFFQMMFALQNTPVGQIEVPGLTLERLAIDSGTTRFELYLEMTETDPGLEGMVQYSLDLFDRTFIGRFIGHYREVLAEMASRPEAPVARLSLLSAAQRAQLLREWNDSAVDLPLDTPFNELFGTTVERCPERVAVACDGDALTYRELDERANALALVLTARGAGPESLVAILSERGLDFLTAVVASFKAGAAYLPLDPHHPAGRIRQILVQARPAVLLVAEALRPLLAEALAELVAAPPVLDLEPAAVGAAAVGPEVEAGPDHLAYSIFTSGSTGVPKGAMLVSRGLVNHLFAMIVELELDENDVVAQTASQCFDISVWQFLTPLVLGGRVEIYPDETAHDPVKLLERSIADAVTVLEIVPSLMRLMLAEIRRGGDGPGLEGLRWLIPTGEALPPELCREWYEVYPEILLVNAYGPAECSDDVSLYRVPAGLGAGRSIPIGRPTLNTELYVLDREQQPVAVGVAGELCIGGSGVGRGYLADPAKTAAVFVPHPVSERPGERLYRSGDLARLRPDGRLEFLGRIDFQVKVRGFRLELGEIEAALDEHPDLSAAVVTARAEASGTNRLVGYVVPRDGEAPSPQGLRDFLQERLPEYAVPTAWMTLESLPLNRNGKVDRKALPDVGDDGIEERPYVAPRDEMEEAVAEIFVEVVGIPKIGVFDNFFDLGGHSLLATQVIWRLRETFDVELALRTLFQAPSVAELAALIEEKIIAQIEELEEAEVDSLLEDAEEPEPVDSLTAVS